MPDFRPLRTIDARYASLPVEQGFDWKGCLADLSAGEWHLVVFRSVRRPTADEALLCEFDERAFQEAKSSSGFRFYFRGDADAERRCLSLCVWDSPEQARVALHGADHQAAVAQTRDWYDSFALERYRLILEAGGDVRIERR
jgi:hypothetical protein